MRIPSLVVSVGGLKMIYFEGLMCVLSRSRQGHVLGWRGFLSSSEMDEPTGGDAGDRWDMWEMEHLDVENREDGYSELLANIRRLTVMVLDDLEEGSRLRTLDQGQKRLLSATGSRLLRLWRLALRDGGSRRVVEEARRIEGLVSGTGERRRKGVEG